jgi:drug/metabolite transporter (DMT)-like permease
VAAAAFSLIAVLAHGGIPADDRQPIFLGWLILDEPISTRTLIASAIIITSVVLITLEKSKPAENPLRKVSHNR